MMAGCSELTAHIGAVRLVPRQGALLTRLRCPRRRAVRHRARLQANEVPFRKKRDKYLFTLGVLNFGEALVQPCARRLDQLTRRCEPTAGVIAYAAGGHPWFLPIYYSIKFPVLITLRYVLYKQRCWHYFLLDFCYFENLLLLSYIWLFPTSNELFLINFALCNGPLAWAVPAFRNSLVFHSLGKTLSHSCHHHLEYPRRPMLARCLVDGWIAQTKSRARSSTSPP